MAGITERRGSLGFSKIQENNKSTDLSSGPSPAGGISYNGAISGRACLYHSKDISEVMHSK